MRTAFNSSKVSPFIIPLIPNRAVARSENPGGHVVLNGDNVSPLIEIRLTDLPKTGGPQISAFIMTVEMQY